MSRIKSAHSSKDQAHLTKIIEQNIRTIINTRHVTANQQTTEERLAGIVANF
jgi:predicted component of type VI protein secretion system